MKTVFRNTPVGKTGPIWLCILLFFLTLHVPALSQQQSVILSDYGYCQYPSVAAANGGATILAVWVEKHSGYKYIYYRVRRDGSWGVKKLFSQPAYSNPEYPHVVADASGDFHMVWMEGFGGGRDIAYARFSDGEWDAWTGNGPNDYIEVSENQRDVWPRLAIDSADDTLYAVWSKHRGTSVNNDAEIFSARKVPGGNWQVERVTYDNYSHLNYHADITARNGRVVTVWEWHFGGIWSSRRLGANNWGSPTQISSSNKWPAVANDHNGNVHALYGLGSMLYSKRTATGAWQYEGALNNHFRYKQWGDIRTDDFNNFYALFQEGPAVIEESLYDNRGYYRNTRLMIVIGDGDGNRDPAELLWQKNHSYIHSPVAAPDNNGGVHIVWFDAGVGFQPNDSLYEWMDWGPIYYIKTAAGPGAAIQVLSPNGGEVYISGDTETITWNASDSIANVHIEVSGDNGQTWYDVVASTENDGAYEVIVPELSSTDCLVRISDASDGEPSDTSDAAFSVYLAGSIPSLTVDHDSLNFGSVNGLTTQSQQVLISNTGGGNMDWTVSSDSNWLSSTPTAGNNTGVITISVTPSGLTAGTYTGILTIDAGLASNSPLNINVTLQVHGSGATYSPFGSFDIPVQNSDVIGSIPVSGWVLDDIEVEKVSIWRDPVDGEPPSPNGYVYIGQGVFVEGARPDVETLYPEYPLNYRAGWGYMLLTNHLPNGGNGSYLLHALATDKEGNTTQLGTKTINCDNANSELPFGAIDTPDQGGEASGSGFINFGWVLTPQPNMIPIDGSTITVWLDGFPLEGHVNYNHYREDIANIFPGYANTEGAVGYYIIDTTEYENGLHNIAWSVTDNADNVAGIGSRYFMVVNTSPPDTASTATLSQNPSQPSLEQLNAMLPDASPVIVKHALNPHAQAQRIHPYGTKAEIRISTGIAEGLVVDLNSDQRPKASFTGFMQVGDQLRSLPIGSTMDAENSIFYWHPGPGFLGDYDLVFVDLDRGLRKRVRITILAKTTSRRNVDS
ncbi:MAG TPA: hypothetical protein ENN40_00640 [Candidatus Aminicenantes bacterium]|nr:hypothetical protein [Candidatus Aminicenantes bacterium]